MVDAHRPALLAWPLMLLLATAAIHAADEPTIRAELERCRMLSYGDPRAAVELADGLLQGSLADELQLGAQACRGRALAALGERTEALRMTAAIGAGLDALDPVEPRVLLLRDLATIHQQLGDVGDSILALERALALVVEAGLDGLEIELLTHIGVHHAQASQYGPAIAHLERALRTAEDIGDDRRAVPVRFNLGQAYRSAGRLEDAERLLSSLLPLLEAPGMELRLAFLLSSLGWIALDLGRIDEAEARFERSAELQAEASNPGEQTVLLNGLATVRLRRGQPEAALDLARQSLDTARQAEDRDAINSGLALLVEVLQTLGRHDEALDLERERAQQREHFLRDEQIARLNELEARLGVERQARELDRLRQDAELQALALQRQRLAVAAALVLVALALAGLYLQRRINRRLDTASRTDALTGLLNRRALVDALARPRRLAAGPMLVAVLDLDHFKAINDQHGHEAGDRALAAVGTELLAHAREHGGLAARWGGEEFVLVLPAYRIRGGRRQLKGVEQRLAALRVPVRGAEALRLSASIGYTRFDPPGAPRLAREWEHVLARADRLLYQAKLQGRARSVGDWAD